MKIVEQEATNSSILQNQKPRWLFIKRRSILSQSSRGSEHSSVVSSSSTLVTNSFESEQDEDMLPTYSCTVYKMGYVYVKKEFDSPNLRSKHRTWRKLYVELWGTLLKIYNLSTAGDRWFIRKRNQDVTIISLSGADAMRALDYFKRPYALRFSTAYGPQLLMRLPSHIEMISWMEHLQAAINISLDLESRSMPKFATLPIHEISSDVDFRIIQIERAREQRRRNQREILI